MEYNRVELNELCSLSQGLQIPIAKRFREDGPNRYFYVTVQFLKDSGDKYFIENPPERVKCTSKDILVVRTGNTGQIITGVDGCFHNNFFKVEPNEKIYPKFLYYTLKSPELYTRMRNVASGTTILDLKHSAFLGLDIYLPDLNNQKKIAYILDIIDQKIKTCDSINKNLDKTIRILYNSWFVDFLPFQNQEFMDTYMGKIPKGWEIKNLDEVCDKISDSYKPNSEEVVLIQTSDVSKGKVLNHAKVPNDDYKGHFKYKFEKNDILYTQIRPKNERYAFINFDPINYVASTQLMVLRAKPNIILPYILYLFLTSRDMIMEVNLLAESRSGTFPQINFTEIKHEKVIVAPFEVYEDFWNIIKSLVEKKFIIDDEIIKLSQLRDTLLPKLMSGEIDVSEINCDL